MIGTILALAIVAAVPPMPLSISITDDALAVPASPAALAARSEEQFCYVCDCPAAVPGAFWTNSTFVDRPSAQRAEMSFVIRHFSSVPVR